MIGADLKRIRAALRPVRSLCGAGLVWLMAAAAAGCATVPGDAGKDSRDPFERVNRHVFEFNERLDRYALRPVAEFYSRTVPQPVQDCVSNFFGNLNDVPTALNNFLQGKVVDGVSDICRVAINTTVGVLGCFDMASKMALEKHREDFGQTLGRWGLSTGPYLVLPFLGPNDVRDSFGLIADIYSHPRQLIEPDAARYQLEAAELVDLRVSLLPATRLVEQSGLDKYRATRDVYLQRRRNAVFDGNPPDDDDAQAPRPKYDIDAADEAPADAQKDGKKDAQDAKDKDSDKEKSDKGPVVPGPVPPAAK